MKKWIAFCICMALFCSMLTGFPVQAKERASTMGNILSGGKAVEADGWLYYCNRGTIYKRSVESGKTVKIVEQKKVTGFSSLNVYDGYLYCIEDEHYGSDACRCSLYKINLDGGGMENLGRAHGAMVYDGWIYYVKVEQMTEYGTQYDQPVGIYKMKTDGARDTCLVKSKDVKSCACDGTYVYYDTKTQIKRVDVSGKNNKVLVKDVNGELAGGAGKKIYYTAYAKDYTNRCLYEVNQDGKGKRKLVSMDGSGNVCISDDFIYYTSGSYDTAKCSLYRMDLNGKNKKKLFTDSNTYSMGHIAVTDHSILYHSFTNAQSSDNEIIYVRNLDGSDRKKLGSYFLS